MWHTKSNVGLHDSHHTAVFRCDAIRLCVYWFWALCLSLFGVIEFGQKSIIQMKSFKPSKTQLSKWSRFPWNSIDFGRNQAQHSNSSQSERCYLGICVGSPRMKTSETLLCWFLFIYRKAILRILARRIGYFWHVPIKRFDEDVKSFSRADANADYL